MLTSADFNTCMVPSGAPEGKGSRVGQEKVATHMRGGSASGTSIVYVGKTRTVVDTTYRTTGRLDCKIDSIYSQVLISLCSIWVSQYGL